ncbi:MAG: zinc-ribbon domain-containing protein [Porphyromonadaceae bacterium]|jgi:phage FluMu protein Com|nr:zinc-ribbon domain-containing protein [Porphyromonadaceae bacterium]
MIIYGSKATQIGTADIDEKCPNCETQNSVNMVIIQRYAHVFWIPFLPIGKKALTQCSHCQQVLEKKEFPSNFRGYYEALKIRSKTPVWTFSGAALLAFFILWIVIGGIQNDKRDAKLILSPEAGDIYKFKTEEGQYTLFKVENVVGDTVLLLMRIRV